MTPTNTAATKAGDLLDWRELAPVAALLRTHECFTDDEDTDIGRDKLDALTAFGWLEKAGRAKWMITALGERIVDRALTTPPAEPALAAEGAKPIIPNWFPDDRCQVCGWPLAQCRDQGCVAGDCSFRPQEGTESYRITQLRRKALAERADPAQPADTPSDDHEYACLRVVYEAARRYLRTEADFPERHAIARDRLEDAIEAVKAIDGGQYEPEAGTPSEAVAVVRRTENGSYYIDWLGKQMPDYLDQPLYALRPQPARREVAEADRPVASDDDRNQVIAQYRVVASLAQTIANIHNELSDLFMSACPEDLLDMLGRDSASCMETLGDILNGMDACSEEDEWMDPIFERAQVRWQAALEAAARVRADHFVDANKIEGDAK